MKKKLPGFVRPVDFQEYQRSVTNYIARLREMDHNDIKQGDLRHCWNNDYAQGDAHDYIVWGIAPKEKKAMTTHIMNAATMPAPGRYEARRVSREEWAGLARKAFESGRWRNSVGYQQNADIICELTGYAIPLDFSPTILEPGDVMLIMRLPYRAGGYAKGEVVPPGDFEYYAATYLATGTQASGPTFGEALRAYLAATGTTQAELARRINAHQGHISKYAAGASSPSAGRIEEIASALGCEIARAGGGWKFTELPNFII